MTDTIKYDEAHDRFRYDRETGELHRRYRQTRPDIKSTAITGVNCRGYKTVHVMKRTYQVHRIIWLMETGAWPHNQIDHIDGNKTNNRMDNLRDVTPRENSQNKLVHRNGKLPGTFYHKRDRLWTARYQVNGIRKSVGYFKTEVEAHRAYVAALQTSEPWQMEDYSPRQTTIQADFITKRDEA